MGAGCGWGVEEVAASTGSTLVPAPPLRGDCNADRGRFSVRAIKPMICLVGAGVVQVRLCGGGVGGGRWGAGVWGGAGSTGRTRVPAAPPSPPPRKVSHACAENSRDKFGEREGRKVPGSALRVNNTVMYKIYDCRC